jgi:hypothetical protein
MSITMTISGADSSPLRRFHWPTAATAWAEEVAPRSREAVKAMSPVGKGALRTGGTGGKPGALRDSVSCRNEPSEGRMWVVLYSTVPYAPFVIGGTKPHVIQAHARTRGGWTGPYTGQPGAGSHTLHWVSGGTDFFAMKVNHPGTKPDNFPERAISPLRPWLIERFASACQEAMDL